MNMVHPTLCDSESKIVTEVRGLTPWDDYLNNLNKLGDNHKSFLFTFFRFAMANKIDFNL